MLLPYFRILHMYGSVYIEHSLIKLILAIED